jgi:hypothetical protein
MNRVLLWHQPDGKEENALKKLNLVAASAAENEDNQWKRIFLAGAGCALAAVLTGLFDIAVTFLPGGGFSAALTMHEWFTLLHTNPLVGLRNLDLPNLIVIPFGLVLNLTLYAAHRKVNRPGAALALVLYLTGSLFLLVKIPALTMLSLSMQYAAASVPHQTALLAAGEAVLAAGESHAPVTFLGFFLTEISGVIISVVMLKGRVFGRLDAWTGIIAFSCLLFYLITRVFLPVLSGIGQIIVIVGGLSGVTWYVLTAITLYSLGRRRTS